MIVASHLPGWHRLWSIIESCSAVVGFKIGVSEHESKNNVLNFGRRRKVSRLGVSSRMWGTGGYMRHEDKRGTGMGQGKQEK
jgi:hypothetical protein